MPFAMQGSWTLLVKSKEAFSTPQRFIISGADTGNGTYNGDPAAPPVHVTGAAWSITAEHNGGAGFAESPGQIVFPTNTGGMYKFDIQFNDDDSDPVFDDLILTCETPVTRDDFLLYGHVSWYSGCFFNPCYPIFVIDTPAALKDALARPALRPVIEKLYPAQVYTPPKPGPGPGPDTAPFRPLLLPVEGQSVLPAKQGRAVNAADRSGIVTLPGRAAANANTSLSASTLASIHETFRFCQTGPLPQFVLRFQEYERTPSEAAGGPYTGTGPRIGLGLATTDRNGNYVFRFHWIVDEFLLEPFTDRLSGETLLVASFPNVIVQVLDATAPSGVLYESAPYFNIPEFKRINICVPRDGVHLPNPCRQGQVIQSIGNITVGPLVGGVRTTSTSSLDANGVITSSSTLGPIVQCSAWASTLYFYACLDEPDIRYYTIRYGRTTDPDNAFVFVTEAFSLPVLIPAFPFQVQQSVGPNPQSLIVDGSRQTVQAYINPETDTTYNWLDRWKVLKMQLHSTIYELALSTGPIVFRIQGYRADGTPVGADDRITLYIDNNGVDQFIDPSLTLITSGGTVTQGNCALFTLPAGQASAPIQVGFRSNQNEGFMNSYQLYMGKGAQGNFPIVSTGPGAAPFPPVSAAFTNCHFRGTSDDAHYGFITPGELVAQIAPATGGWLDPCQTFCAFSINLTSTLRVTDGQVILGPYYSGPILIGIQQPPCPS